MRLNKLTSVVASLLAVTAALSFDVGYSSPLASQSTGTIIGRVLDCYDARVANATISIDSEKTKRRVKSDEEGEFEVSLPAGNYRITVEANGFRRFVYFSVKVKPPAIKVINIHLEVAVPPGLVPASGKGAPTEGRPYGISGGEPRLDGSSRR